MALLANGELCVCDLMAVLSLPQSTVSRHLSYLKNTGWVLDRRQGTWMHYHLNQANTALQQANTALQQALFAVLQKELTALGQAREDAAALTAYLATKKISCAC